MTKKETAVFVENDPLISILGNTEIDGGVQNKINHTTNLSYGRSMIEGTESEETVIERRLD